MTKLRVSIVGASGYAGGDLLRILLGHPNVEVVQITSESYAGKPATRVHPNLRKRTDLKFSSINDLESCDLLFLALPHKVTMNNMKNFMEKAERIIDLSGDFRLDNPEAYAKWYGEEHTAPELMEKFVYGIPELHKEEMSKTKYISSAGCNATATILGLYPLLKNGLVNLDMPVVSEAKAGSSQSGNKSSPASHHPERSGCVRSYKPTSHRHVAEMLQELTFDGSTPDIHFSATSIEMVRGILSTSHVFLKDGLTEKDVWQAYRKEYGEQPFIRIVKERTGIYRYPEPKLVAGSNYADIGFVKDEDSNRLVVITAIDNLMKGAAGQAVQGMNIMMGYPEDMGLEFPGLHPV